MGRTLIVRHQIAPSITKALGYTRVYNNDGSVYQEYYGVTGHLHTYNYNTAAHAISLNDGAGNTNVDNATYTPFGALATRSRDSGGALTEKFSYNNRLQPAEIYTYSSTVNPILDICYDFHSGVAVS